ncbi:hypothetical protein LQ772_14845 [Frateuria edaphi]|uniref:hypothetical protein n=1 Tax=Frateuria edaphi TaxID=2898793 RepID=UPI001E376270|nr:hypothetical protein [Frateuria edaphi]UGB45241.1 hypothetical protein LQ772_14845 [Frateuria edaphi]
MPLSASEFRRIVTEVLDGQVSEQPWFYLLLAAATFIGGACGAFLSAYFKKRGETLATKADFNGLLAQLRQSTHLAEEIKADIQTKYGEQSTLRALLRERTESIVMATFELESWLGEARARAFQGESFESDSSPMSKISALRDIYFPDIGIEFTELRLRYIEYIQWLLGLQGARLTSGGNVEMMQPHIVTFNNVYQPFSAALAPFRAKVIASARARGGL